MDFLTPLGLLVGAIAVWYTMTQANMTSSLFNLSSLILVLGGTLGSTLMTYPWSVVKKIPMSLWLFVFPPQKVSISNTIERICELATNALNQGIDILQELLIPEDDKFLKSGVRMLLGDLNEQTLRENMENEIEALYQRHQQVQKVFISMSGYAPVYGLLGTLVGILGVLKYIGDPIAMGQSMMMAIITTFYGIFGANFIFLPAAGKLESYTEHEILTKQVIMMGIISMKQGQTPDVIKAKLEKFIAQP